MDRLTKSRPAHFAFTILAVILSAGVVAAAAERAAPASDAKACPRYGAGFFEVPGTATCVRISGRATSSYTAGTRRVSRDEIAGFATGARVAIDSRTDTDYGPVRAYVRVRAGSGTPR